MKRFTATLAAAAVIAAIGLSAGTSTIAMAQSVSSDDIVNQLKPRKPTGGLTRSFKKDPDDVFLEELPSRGIRIEERKKLDEIVKKQDLPKIDIEINFDYDSAEIRPESLPDIDELGKALTSDALAESRIVLNGHTDAAGTDAYNQELSDRRAASVRNYLMSKFSIDGDRLIAIGYGEERLKNTGDPLAAENRRVEIINLTKG